jgi:hypothetical protein
VLTVTSIYIRIKASYDTGHLASGRAKLVGPNEADRPCKVGSRRVCRLKNIRPLSSSVNLSELEYTDTYKPPKTYLGILKLRYGNRKIRETLEDL